MTDFRTYSDPGIYIEELPGPLPNPPGIAPTVVALIGDSQRFRSYSEVVQLSSTTAVQLTKLGISATSIVVRDRFTGVTYTLGATGTPETGDYIVATQAGADGVAATADDTTTVRRSSVSTIPSGAYVTVTYNYTPPEYYNTYGFTSYDEVREHYGDPFDSTGAVKSPISLAAFLAFQNGAAQVVTAGINGTALANWTTAIDKLVDRPEVNVVVPVTGDTAVHDTVKTHITQMGILNSFRLGIVGRDGSITTVTPTQLTTQAAGYSNDHMVVVGPARFNFYNGRASLALGGQYAAAAVAGALASRDVHIPLTHKTITGFWQIPDQVRAADMLALQRGGVLTLFQRRTGEIIVKHGLTTKMTNDYTREISVVAAKDRMRRLVQETLEFSGLIGGVITDTTGEDIIGTVTAALETARAARLIFGYSGMEAQQLTTSPTAFRVKYQYRPSLPLNYIAVQFALDIGAGSVEFEEAA